MMFFLGIAEQMDDIAGLHLLLNWIIVIVVVVIQFHHFLDGTVGVGFLVNKSRLIVLLGALNAFNSAVFYLDLTLTVVHFIGWTVGVLGGRLIAVSAVETRRRQALVLLIVEI